MPRPLIPYFGSGPAAKHPGWKCDQLKDALVARSHRSAAGLNRIQHLLTLMRNVLEIPEEYKITLISGSATGAFESLLWNLIGHNKVQVHTWDIFGERWARDVSYLLKNNCNEIVGLDNKGLPQLEMADFSKDVIFTINGSTSGISVNGIKWIEKSRKGLIFCDATSAAFAVPLPWDDLDATAFSFQKGLGGEAGLGVIVLSPKAIERIKEYRPLWPIPYLLRLTTEDGKLNENLFGGYLINTPSMLLIEDAIQALNWAILNGGQRGLYQKTLNNYRALKEWLSTEEWIDFSVHDEAYRSMTTVCLQFTESWFSALTREEQWKLIHQFCDILSTERVAYDITAHAAAKPSLRIWCGPTIDSNDLKKLFLWLESAYIKVRA